MKILVPTDFSECADFAFDAACKLAQTTSSELHLFHVALIPQDFIGLNKDSALMDDLKEKLKLNVSKLLSEREEIARSFGIKLKTDFSFGKFEKSVIEYDDLNNFDLVVMGSYGASGKTEWFIGSNTQKLVRKLRKNILVIKEPLKHLNFEKVMFPSNLTTHDKEAFLEFIDFLKIFNTKEIHILAVNTSGYFSQPATLMVELLGDFKELVVGMDCKTHFTSDYSVEAGIRHFSDKFDIKLIGISNMVRNPIKRLFQGSNVEMLVNHSDIPVLVIDHD
jgi:nucleotide-binding universal stress UspA family protein